MARKKKELQKGIVADTAKVSNHEIVKQVERGKRLLASREAFEKKFYALGENSGYAMMADTDDYQEAQELVCFDPRHDGMLFLSDLQRNEAVWASLEVDADDYPILLHTDEGGEASLAAHAWFAGWLGGIVEGYAVEVGNPMTYATMIESGYSTIEGIAEQLTNVRNTPHRTCLTDDGDFSR
jgi:hypothetical protein